MQPRHRRQRVTPSLDGLTHPERPNHVWAADHGSSLKTFWSNANYRESLAIHQHVLPDHRCIGPKSTLPEAMAQHHHRACSGGTVFFRTKCASQLRAHAQHIKVISRR